MCAIEFFTKSKRSVLCICNSVALQIISKIVCFKVLFKNVHTQSKCNGKKSTHKYMDSHMYKVVGRDLPITQIHSRTFSELHVMRWPTLRRIAHLKMGPRYILNAHNIFVGVFIFDGKVKREREKSDDLLQ